MEFFRIKLGASTALIGALVLVLVLVVTFIVVAAEKNGGHKDSFGGLLCRRAYDPPCNYYGCCRSSDCTGMPTSNSMPSIDTPSPHCQGCDDSFSRFPFVRGVLGEKCCV